MPTKLPPPFFKIIYTINLVAVVLGIVGGTQVKNFGQWPANITGLSNAAIVLYLVVFIVLLATLCLLSSKRAQVRAGDGRLLLAVAVCIPILLVRYIYSLRYDFTGDQRRNSVAGDVTLYLCMNFLEEVVVVLIALGVGLTVDKAPRSAAQEFEPASGLQGTTAEYGMVGSSDGSKQGPAEAPPRQIQYPRQRPRGPISLLIRSARDYIGEREQQGLGHMMRQAPGVANMRNGEYM